jgi:ribonucleoside-triphosphate reductase
MCRYSQERLLGVSLTGIMDNRILAGLQPADGRSLPEVLEHLKGIAVATNSELAAELGIQVRGRVSLASAASVACCMIHSRSPSPPPGVRVHHVREAVGHS